MPKFVLQGQNDPRFQALDPFTRAYIEAAIFTEEENLGPVGTTAVQQLADETISAMAADCARFLTRSHPILELDEVTCRRGSGDYTKHEQAGHDFWLTRNGHGAGFWDGDWSEPAGARLTEISKEFGEIDLYRGRDGRIYS